MKDENKKTAITKTIISLINEIGFANISMSKIAKATGISASTLYVYYESKGGYVSQNLFRCKKQMIAECSRDICQDEPLEQSVRKICKNLLVYMQKHTDEFLFIEQACNSPLATDEMIETLEQYNKTAIAIFQSGIDQGILKQTSPALLISFCYYPIQQIFKEWRKETSMLPNVDFDLVFQMCWDAIKR